jgi:chemotaxis protein methyltransferase CheR
VRDRDERRHDAFGYSADILGFTEPAFVLLRDVIAQRTGVFFADDKRDLLADKLADLVAANGMTSFLDYYYLLRYDTEAERHWSELTDRLAVPETYFWRQHDQLLALANVVAPAHFARTGGSPASPLRVWSAACCTGEEPLSIAIALAEAGLLEQHPVEIVATDASQAMLERARRGLYGERSFRSLPAHLRERWFRREGELWRVDPRLHARVRWGMVNLVDAAAVRSFAAADVVYCRNVFIYFSDETIGRVARALADGMPDEGVLFLGASESLTRLPTDFALTEIGGAFAYVKGRGQGGAR